MDGVEYNYRDFIIWYRAFCWTLALSWPLYATFNLWYICSLHRLKNPLSLLIKLRYLMLVPFIVAFISEVYLLAYTLGVFYGTIVVWTSTEVMKLVTVSVLATQGVVNFIGIIVMLTIHPGTKTAQRWNPCWCGSCPVAAGEEVAPGIPDPVSLEGWIKYAKEVDKCNKLYCKCLRSYGMDIAEAVSD